jgi:hypothetical protein
MKKLLFAFLLLVATLGSSQEMDIKKVRIAGNFDLPNSIEPLDYEDFLIFKTNASEYLPVKDDVFQEHIRFNLTQDEEQKIRKIFDSNSKKLKKSKYSKLVEVSITSILERDKKVWLGTKNGLYHFDINSKKITKHESYGIDGPLATNISDIVMDSKGNMWVGTPIGLSILSPDGNWSSIRGADGLPVEEITALVIDKNDNIWIGTTQGAILYKPYSKERQWFYRAGKRYIINDAIEDIELDQEGRTIYFKTKAGISKMISVNRTLSQKAEIIENKLNERHRRLGMVAVCVLDDPENPSSYTIRDNDNDGLWTSYHVVAMSLAYATTRNKAYLESAKESMHAMIMLQNASGTPGLVARSVVPISERDKMSAQWKETPDGKLLWKSDTSSDEIDGHFFAFYAYWEHIAQKDPEEAELIKQQISTLMNYIVDNNYQLIDWDGKRTRWGFWNPELLNDDGEHYIENGLNSAQILSFLKVSYYITGNEKFKKHYDQLITEHGYLANVLTEKKVFPDMNNHSDNQLGFVALYPLLQLEYDPLARTALRRTVRRHYRTLGRDGSAFFYFAAATIDPDYVDIIGGVTNLRQIPTDRRQWKMMNSNRKDITWNPYKNRFNRVQLLNVLPADERNFDRWNRNPYTADGGNGGNYEDDGGSWLLAYWLGRYHGFIN